jgi:hypothetical protein
MRSPVSGDLLLSLAALSIPAMSAEILEQVPPHQLVAEL